MILTDNILLEIFDLYRHTHDDTLWEWYVLVHVCRRWRQIVFESPRRLDLKIRCTIKTPVENLSIWPPFPIAIDFRCTLFDYISNDAIAAFVDTGRVSYLKLDLAYCNMKTWLIMASKPFPALTHLIIRIPVENALACPLPDDFWGESAPYLQIIHLDNITIPALQRLLLSASHLVELQLHFIASYSFINCNIILPEAMAICLAQLPRLKTLVLQFCMGFPPPGPIHPSPVTVTRIVLPALTDFEFTGTSKYLEDFVAQIDCPQLDQIKISYQMGPTEFQVAQLIKFFSRSISPFRHAKICLDARSTIFNLYPPPNCTGWDSRHPATTVISCSEIANTWYFSPMFDELLSVLLLTVVRLKFVGGSDVTVSLRDEYNPDWLHFLRQPSALQAIYASPAFAGKIGRALKSVKGEVVAEALPYLDLICLEGQASYLEELVAVRQVSGCPFTVVSTEAEFDQRLSEKLMMTDVQ